MRDAWFYVEKVFNVVPAVSSLIFILGVQTRLLLLARRQMRAVQNNGRKPIPRRQDHQELPIEPAAPSTCCTKVLSNNILRSYARNKAIFTVLISTGPPTLVLFSHAFVYSYDVITVQIVFDLLTASGTWMQPMIYLSTNPEARTILRRLFP